MSRYSSIARFVVPSTMCCLMLLSIKACSDNNDDDQQDPSNQTMDMNDSSDMSGDMPADDMAQDMMADNSTCSQGWSQVGVQGLGACGDDAKHITSTLMNLSGRTILNNGATMTPCLQYKCDADFVYVVSNSLPHYDFVQTTPNALVENLTITKIPKTPKVQSGQGTAVDTIQGCDDAFTGYAAGRATPQEPSGYCAKMGTATIEDGGKVYQQLPCFNTIATMTNGVPVFGPNEGAIPEPYGTPLFVMPEKVGQGYRDGERSVGLDLCGGHTANAMHYHGANEACFELDAEQKPVKSYADAAQFWDIDKLLQGECTEPSGVLAWSPDGYPIKGPCVCMTRDGDGQCTSVKRARSSYEYGGLKAWANGRDDSALSVELKSCQSDSDCAGDSYFCNQVVVGSGDSSSIEKRCVLHSYAWCVHQFKDKSSVDEATFVHMDRCNGIESADGYAYHATVSFPHMMGCYRGEVTGSAQTISSGNMMMDNNMMGNPPKCADIGQTERCCGDGMCGGPENANNCPEDC